MLKGGIVKVKVEWSNIYNFPKGEWESNIREISSIPLQNLTNSPSARNFWWSPHVVILSCILGWRLNILQYYFVLACKLALLEYGVPREVSCSYLSVFPNKCLWLVWESILGGCWGSIPGVCCDQSLGNLYLFPSSSTHKSLLTGYVCVFPNIHAHVSVWLAQGSSLKGEAGDLCALSPYLFSSSSTQSYPHAAAVSKFLSNHSSVAGSFCSDSAARWTPYLSPNKQMKNGAHLPMLSKHMRRTCSLFCWDWLLFQRKSTGMKEVPRSLHILFNWGNILSCKKSRSAWKSLKVEHTKGRIICLRAASLLAEDKLDPSRSFGIDREKSLLIKTNLSLLFRWIGNIYKNVL